MRGQVYRPIMGAMQPLPARRFTLLDAIILIAATVAGIEIHRAVWPTEPPLGPVRNLGSLIQRVVFWSAPPAAMWTAATLVLQLRSPRPRLRRLLGRPGVAVCCAVSSALVLGAALIGCAMRANQNSFFSTTELIAVYGTPLMAGSAAAAAWVLSLLSWGYRPAADWLDRLGRLMGLYWMVSLVAMGWIFASW